jgi:hypothetical protein
VHERWTYRPKRRAATTAMRPNPLHAAVGCGTRRCGPENLGVSRIPLLYSRARPSLARCPNAARGLEAEGFWSADAASGRPQKRDPGVCRWFLDDCWASSVPEADLVLLAHDRHDDKHARRGFVPTFFTAELLRSRMWHIGCSICRNRRASLCDEKGEVNTPQGFPLANYYPIRE